MESVQKFLPGENFLFLCAHVCVCVLARVCVRVFVCVCVLHVCVFLEGGAQTLDHPGVVSGRPTTNATVTAGQTVRMAFFVAVGGLPKPHANPPPG